MSLVDDEKQEANEIEAVEQREAKPRPKPFSELPEKYRGKSIEEVALMHSEVEKRLSVQGQEIGEVRKLADELIRQNLESKQSAKKIEPEVDFFEDPQAAIQKAVDNHPDVQSSKLAFANMQRMQIKQQLASTHPDLDEITKDQNFVDWIKSSPVRIKLFEAADAGYDFDSANELLSTYKQIRGARAKQGEVLQENNRQVSLRAAAVDVGGSGESSKKTYRRIDLQNLLNTNPERYTAMQDEIMQAYREKRVI
jgi:hypothetical protein